VSVSKSVFFIKNISEEDVTFVVYSVTDADSVSSLPEKVIPFHVDLGIHKGMPIKEGRSILDNY